MTEKFYMPEQTFRNWMADLRSGKYQQGKGALEVRNEDGTKSYCCLGVLQMGVSGKVETRLSHIHGAPPILISQGLPTFGWCRENGIQFEESPGISVNGTSFHWVVGGYSTSLHLQNDSGTSFSEIADILEKHYGGPLP